MAKIIDIDNSKFAVGTLHLLGAASSENTLLADGSTLLISVYKNLFDKIGTQFGGDGITTFRLPDTRSRSLLGSGQGAGLTLRTLGDTGGTETEVLSNLPLHSHTGTVSTTGSHTHTYNRPNVTPGDADTGGQSDGTYKTGVGYSTSDEPSLWTNHTHSGTLSNEGIGAAHNNIHPMLVATCVIVYR